VPSEARIASDGMKAPRALRSAVLLKVILLAGLLFSASRVVAPATFQFSAGKLDVRVTPAVPGGKIMLDLGPFGELSWRTHRTPLNVRAAFVVGRSPRALPALSELRDLRVAFLLRKLPWLALTGAFAALLVVEGPRRRRGVAAGIGAAATIALGGLLVGGTILTFDARALDRPHYRGPIEDAPRVLAILKEVSRDIAGARRNINKVAEGLERLHSQIVSSAAPIEQRPTVRYLVISDVHNNPLGLLIAKELVDRFAVKVVLNAGDFTDRGSEPEAELFARFGALAPRQIVVGGNHEDRPTMDRIRRVPGVTVLERGATDLVDLDGVTVLGDSDPNSYGISSNPFDPAALAEIPIRCVGLKDRWIQTHATILMVHDPKMGACAAEEARTEKRPLVFVWGHTHKAALAVNGMVLELSDGTSGANGIKTPKPAPYGFGLIEFDAETHEVASACVFQFDDPAHLSETTCLVSPLTPEPQG
jgi:predicted phosphodiesterase